jgi:hypothetical protein
MILPLAGGIANVPLPVTGTGLLICTKPWLSNRSTRALSPSPCHDSVISSPGAAIVALVLKDVITGSSGVGVSDGVCVAVGVCVSVLVGDALGCGVLVLVGVGLGVRVSVGEGVKVVVGVRVNVAVGSSVGVNVTVGVSLAVALGKIITVGNVPSSAGLHAAPHITNNNPTMIVYTCLMSRLLSPVTLLE